MSSSYDLRSALADALPAAGPTRAAVKAMDDVGFKADPKNNDMKELFSGLGFATSGDTAGTDIRTTGQTGTAGSGPGSFSTGRTSAAQVLLDYRREKKAANETAERDAAIRLAAGAGTGLEKSPAIQGVGLARAAGVGSQELDNAADDERHLRKMNQSKTAAKLSSKQKRRMKHGKEHGTAYAEKYEGKVMHKSRRKGRIMAMKQMY